MAEMVQYDPYHLPSNVVTTSKSYFCPLLHIFPKRCLNTDRIFLLFCISLFQHTKRVLGASVGEGEFISKELERTTKCFNGVEGGGGGKQKLKEQEAQEKHLTCFRELVRNAKIF